VTVPGKYTYFIVNDLVKDWYNNPSTNYGVLIKYTTAVENNLKPKKMFYSSEYTTGTIYTKPKLVVNYRPNGEYGITDYWTYTPELFNGIGEGKVNVVNGNLVYNIDLFSAPSRTGAFDLQLTYNNQSSYNDRVGYGWALNVGRKLIISSDKKAIQYIDDIGTRYDFNKLQSDTATSYTTPAGTYFDLEVVNSQYVITHPDQTKYYFDSYGRNVKIVYDNNNIVTYSYNGTSTQILTISERYGSETMGKDLSLSYDVNGKLLKIVDPKGTETTLSYTSLNSKNMLTGISKASNRTNPETTVFEYNTNNLLSSIVDANLNKSKIEYDSSKRVVKVIDPRSDSLFYQLSYTNADPATETNYYSRMIKSTVFTDLNNVKTQYINSVDSQYLTVNTTEITTDYDTTNEATTKYTWKGNRVTAVYEPDPSNGEAKTTASQNSEYYETGYIESSNSSTGNSEKYGYDDYNNLETTTSNTLVTNNIYDQNNNLISTSDPLSVTDFSKYDKYGNTIESYGGTSTSFNKILNSSFEYVDSNSFPINWFRRSAGGTYTIDTTNKLYGKNSIKISGAPTADSWGYIYAKYNVNPDETNKEYTVSGYVKTDNLVGTGAYFSVYFIDSSGNYIKDSTGQTIIQTSQKVNGTKDWQRVSYTFKAPSNTAVLHFEADVKGTGTANLDGVQLVYGSIVNEYSSNENTSFEDRDSTTNKIKSWDLLSSLLTTSDGYIASTPATETTKSRSGNGLLRITGSTTANKFFWSIC
jgi:hypothetical protein